MHSAFNPFVFRNYMFKSFFVFFCYFVRKGYELSGEIALKNNHYYYYIVVGVVDIVVDVDIADIIVNIMVINVAVGDVIDGVFVFEQTCCGDWGN